MEESTIWVQVRCGHCGKPRVQADQCDCPESQPRVVKIRRVPNTTKNHRKMLFQGIAQKVEPLKVTIVAEDSRPEVVKVRIAEEES